MRRPSFRGAALNLALAFALILAIVAVSGGVFRSSEPASAQVSEGFYREVPIDTAKVLTVDAVSPVLTGWRQADVVGIYLTCTEDSGTATLDVTAQKSWDGTTWQTLVAFTQLSATGSEAKMYANVFTASPQMIGDRIRLNYDITGSGQYTCSTHMAGQG